MSETQLITVKPAIADHALVTAEQHKAMTAAAAADPAAFWAREAGRVAWIVEPVPNVFWWSSGQSQEDPRRHDVLAATMRSLAAARPDRVSVIDLAGWIDMVCTRSRKLPLNESRNSLF